VLASKRGLGFSVMNAVEFNMYHPYFPSSSCSLASLMSVNGMLLHLAQLSSGR
jgi:hypothetical protein